MHGFTDYVGRFAHLGQFFSELGYDFYGMDQRGHGKSEGETAYIHSIDAVVDDTILFHRSTLQKHYINQKIPVFVLAFSMGCMQMLNILMRKN